jgi:hypothetical protein
MSRRLSTAERLDRDVLEADFQSQVLQLAGILRWRRAHFRPGLNRRGEWRTAVAGDGSGFPDLILVRGERVLAVELKSERGRTTPEQEEWLAAFAGAGVEACVWRPSDFRSGLIQRCLSSTGKRP